MSAGPAATRAARVSPYKGLVPYSAEDASFFFGRERERDVVIANLRARHLTVVYGESGVGKSSLLHAGVLSELRTQARDDLEDRETPEFMPVVFSSWRDDPVEGLLEAVRESVAEILPDHTIGPAQAEGLPETLDAWARELDCEFLIILDQFEEYFLYHGREEGEGTFDLEFPRALNRSGLGASFLLAIREDAFAKLDRFKTRVPGLLDNYLRIRHLDETAARLAIRLPLEAWNATVEEGERVEIEAALVQAVIDEVESGISQGEQAGQGVIEHDGQATAGERVEAPYLQLVMTRLWDEETKQGSRRLRLQTLERLGGAESIVQNHLDDAMSHLPAEEREVAADAFYYLVTPEGTKIAQSVETLAAYSRHSTDEVERVLEKLTTGGVRILRPVAPAPGARGGTRYEIFHDVLAPAILDWRSRMERVKLEREREEAQARQEEAQRQERFQRRRAQQFRGLAALLGLLFAGAVALGLWAFDQKRTADRERALSQSRNLVQGAIRNIAIDPELSVLLARQAMETKRTPEAEAVLRESLMASHMRRAYVGHVKEVNTAALSPDGKLMVTGSDDQTARVWNTATGKTVRKLEGHGSSVSSAAFSPNGNQVVTAGWDLAVRVWDLVTGRSRELKGHTKAVQWARFSPDGRLIASASRDRTVRIWDAATGKVRGVMRGHRGWVNTVEFSPDGRFIVTAADDNTARIWRRATGEQIRVLAGHGGFVNSAAFSPDGRQVITASQDNSARIWNRAGHVIRTIRGHDEPVTSAAFSHDGNRAVTTSEDRTARVWDVSHVKEPVALLHGHSESVLGAEFSAADDYVVTASLDETARLWKVPTSPRILGHGAPVFSAEFNASGTSLVTASADGTASVWDASRLRTGKVLQDPSGPVLDAMFDRDQRFVLTAGIDRAVLWDVGQRRVVREFKAPARAQQDAPVPPRATVSPDGKLVLIAGYDDTARLFDRATGRQVRLLRERSDYTVRDAVFSPDGKLVVTVGDAGLPRIFDAATGEQTTSVSEGSTVLGVNDLYAAAFSSDGKFLATAGEGTVKLWDVQKRPAIKLAELTGDLENVYGVAFSPDGKLLVTADANGTVRLWDRAVARHLGVLLTHQADVLHEDQDDAIGAAFSPGGKLVATAGLDGTARIVRCDACGTTDDLLGLARTRVTRELSPQEKALYLGESGG